MSESLVSARLNGPAVSEHEIGVTDGQRSEHSREVGGVVLEVGVLNHDRVVIGGDGERVCETSANRGTLAPVLWMKEGDCSAIGPAIVHQRAHSPQRRLVRAVVDKDGLRVPAFSESRGADA